MIELLPSHMERFAYFRNLAKQADKAYVPVFTSGYHVPMDKLATALDAAIALANSFGTRLARPSD